MKTDQPKPNEWTADYVQSLSDSANIADQNQEIADAHNAALAAKEKECADVMDAHELKLKLELDDALAAEREKYQRLSDSETEQFEALANLQEKEIQQLRSQLNKQGWLLLDANKRLAAAQSAMKRINSQTLDYVRADLALGNIREWSHASDTTALDATMAAAQKPLVDALEWLLQHYGLGTEGRKRVDAALAKIEKK